MNINYRIFKLFSFAMASLLFSCNTLVTPGREQSNNIDTEATNKCLQPIYGDFSYPIEADNENLSIPGLDMFVLPPSPWQIEAPLPEIDRIVEWNQKFID